MNYEEKTVSVCCNAVWESLNILKRVETKSWFKYIHFPIFYHFFSIIQQQVPNRVL